MSRIEQIVDLHRRGGLTLNQLIFTIIERANEFKSADIVNALNSTELSELRKTVAAAPTAEEEWSHFLVIVGGSFAISQEEANHLAKSKYKLGIELLRNDFLTDAHHGSS